MTVRPPLTAIVLALVLGLLAAFAAACGEEDRGLLSSGRADSLKSSLDDVEEFVANGRCSQAAAALADVRRKIEALPASVDRQLRQRLREGAENLATVSPGDCRDNAQTETDTTTTETTPTETVPPTTTETTPTETTPTTPTETTPTTPTVPTTPTTPTPTEPTVPDGTGGDEAPPTDGAGAVPPGQAKKDNAR